MVSIINCRQLTDKCSPESLNIFSFKFNSYSVKSCGISLYSSDEAIACVGQNSGIFSLIIQVDLDNCFLLFNTLMAKHGLQSLNGK